MRLKIAKTLSLPIEAVTQAIGIIAKRRAGKSYTMRRLTEQLLKAGQQVVIVDPKGDQWGIRSGADGKSAGYSVIILGGERADVPLEVNSGEIVAKLVVEERVSVLIDLSLFRKHEVATFMTAFMENLYRLKAKESYRTPLMLVIDEADAIAPQKPQKGEERMLGAAEDIVRRGGQRGIGCVLVTQRAAVLNKNVLTQVQMLVALRTIAPQDLDAMKAWIEVHGTLEQQKTLMESLPSLPIGDAWFWSPGWPDAEGIFQRVHVLPIETFDSGATPKPGEKRIEPKNAADVDLDALRRQMTATIERAKANDPSELKKKLREQENRIRQLEAQKPQPQAKPTKEQIEKEAARLSKPYQDAMLLAKGTVAGIIKSLRQEADALDKMKWPEKNVILDVPRYQVTKIAPQVAHERNLQRFVPKERPPIASNGEAKIGLGARRMLRVLIQYHPNDVPEGQMRALAGLKKSGTFSNYKSQLRTAGLVEESGGKFRATDLAIQEYGHEADSAPSTTEEVVNIWGNRLGAGARRMLQVLVDARGEFVSEDYLLDATGMNKSGTWSNYKSQLRTANLIVTEGNMIAAKKESLFL